MHRAATRKRFGQHFLTDLRVVERIVRAVAPRAEERIVEIGPGRAALSRALLESGATLHMIEIDRDLASGLKALLAGYENACLHVGDALDMDLSAIVAGRPFRLVGNLPYNISTPLLFHVLQWSKLIVDMHLMLQREVVERMAASPGGKARGRLSIMCQYHCEVTTLFDVPPEAFSPAPRVHSAMVRLRPHPEPPVDVGSMDSFQHLVRQAFATRRKTLRNCLRGLLEPEQIESAGIDPGLRPEALGLAEFAALSRLMNQSMS